jgi:hypothetical protein
MARQVKAHESTGQKGVNPEPSNLEPRIAQFRNPEHPAEKVPPQSAGLVRSRQNGLNITKVSLGLKAIFFKARHFRRYPIHTERFLRRGTEGMEFGIRNSECGLRPGEAIEAHARREGGIRCSSPKTTLYGINAPCECLQNNLVLMRLYPRLKLDVVVSCGCN